MSAVALWLVILGVAASGCVGGQTGSEAQRSTDDYGSGRPATTLESTPAGGATGQGTLATESPCASTLALEEPSELGFSATDVLGRFDAGAEPVLSWETGESTGLSLVVTAAPDVAPDPEAPVCVTRSDSAVALEIPVRLALETSDGRLHTELAGILVARGLPAPGPLELELEADGLCEPPAGTGAAACGTPDLDLGAYRALRFELRARFQSDASGWHALGVLRILGAVELECTGESECPEPPVSWISVSLGSFASP